MLKLFHKIILAETYRSCLPLFSRNVHQKGPVKDGGKGTTEEWTRVKCKTPLQVLCCVPKTHSLVYAEQDRVNVFLCTINNNHTTIFLRHFCVYETTPSADTRAKISH